MHQPPVSMPVAPTPVAPPPPVPCPPARVAHYQTTYSRKLKVHEKATGVLTVKLDPYRVCDVYGVRGGAREQIIKKGLRWTSKGDSERKVIKEIMQACERRLEMLDEDNSL